MTTESFTNGVGAILVFDTEQFRIRLASSSAPLALGYTMDELNAASLITIFPDISRRAWRRLMARMAANKSSVSNFETRAFRADGGSFMARIRLNRMGGDDQNIVCAVIHGTIDDRQLNPRLDAALLRSIIATAPDAIITIERDGRIRSFSPAAERLFGYEADEVIGHNVSMLMPDAYRSEHDSYLERYLTTREKRIIGIGRTVMARKKGGATFPIELAVGEVKSGKNHIFTSFIRDISERVAAQDRANKLQQDLGHISRLSAMGELTSVIVHELNQPLTAIANFGEAAKRLVDAGGQSGRAAEFMGKSVAQAHRASEMIRRLRGFVSQGLNETEPIDVNEVVREASRLALIGAADQHIQTRLALAEDLPEVTADRIQVTQVLVNLIRNGIDAMIDARIDAASMGLIVVQTQSDGQDVRVSVRDTGPGISSEIAKEIFNPFVTTKKGGMGIGLSVSRSIVEAHGGGIWAEPAEGGGACFIFTLPIARADGRSVR